MKLSGVKAHIWQRISAVYLLFFFPYLVFAVFSLDWPTQSLIENMHLLFTPAFSILSFIALTLILTHAWVGVRDIIIDYLPENRVNTWLRLYALFLALIVIDIAWLISHFFPM